MGNRLRSSCQRGVQLYEKGCASGEHSGVVLRARGCSGSHGVWSGNSGVVMRVVCRYNGGMYAGIR